MFAIIRCIVFHFAIQKFKDQDIFPVVLYGCETWELKWSEKRRVRVFENRVLGEYLDLGRTR